MTAILGIVGSARPWGNSELLVRQALQGAKAEGVTAQMIRLTNLRLEPCTGCMRCVIGGKPCRLADDMDWLIEAIRAADGLVLAAPTYFLGPAAVIKLVLDRMLMVTGQMEEALPPPRPAITIVTAGLKDWRGVTLPYLNALVAAFGFLPVESLTAIAPGPGEVLLDDNLMAQALAAGRRLAHGELEPAPAPPNVCPICRCDSFTLKGNRAICPICGRQATVEQVGDSLRLRFDPASGANHRWTPEGLRTHMSEWVMATGPRFLARRGEIKTRRRSYRRMDMTWLCPPPSEGLPKK
jgi:multimeric flavodoxin WrbA